MSDFLGGFRPNRHRDRSLAQMQAALASLNASPLLAAAGQAVLPAPPTPAAPDLQALLVGARQRLDAAAAHVKAQPDGGTATQLEQLRAAVAALGEAVAGVCAPFEWADGPLVQAMRRGDMILVDELNLAEDAVLERLNRWVCGKEAWVDGMARRTQRCIGKWLQDGSPRLLPPPGILPSNCLPTPACTSPAPLSVLEPGRSLTLAEKGGAGAGLVVAHPAFRLVATMNPGEAGLGMHALLRWAALHVAAHCCSRTHRLPPHPPFLPTGGDYGKKELSPALSNRFTSIWVPAIQDSGELLAILESCLAGG